MAQPDGGYPLPDGFTKDSVLQIFGYNTTEELEGFLRKCPRHYLRNYFAEVYLGSADRVHEIRSNNDKYLLNKLVGAIRAAGIPIDVRKRQTKARHEPEPKPARDSPQLQKAHQRPANRTAQPASFSMTARAGPGPHQPLGMPAQLPLPAHLIGGAWAGEAGAGMAQAQAQQLAQLQALMQQQLLLPGLLQYYQALLPALHQMQVLGPQAQLRQLAALQAAAPGLGLLDGAAGLALLPSLGAFAAPPPEQPQPQLQPHQRLRAALTELRAAAEPGSPAMPATETATASGTTESAGGSREREAEVGSGSDPESPRRAADRKRLAGFKRGRVAQASRLGDGQASERKAQRSRSSTRSSPEPGAATASDESAAAFRALLSAVEVAQNERS